MTLGGLAEVFKLFELGSSNALVPIVRTFDVFDILGAVHPVDAFFGRDENADGVPLTGGLGGIDTFGRTIELVKPTGFLRILALGVVENLDFRAGAPRCAFAFLNVIHETGIAAGRDFIIGGEFKGPVLLFGDDVAATFFEEGEGSVLDDPGVFDAFLFVVTEMLHCFAVEEESPASFFLGGGQFVGFVMVGRERQGEEKKW